MLPIASPFIFLYMDSYHVSWLLDELQTLTQKDVISEGVARRIAEYYGANIPAGRFRTGQALPSVRTQGARGESGHSMPLGAGRKLAKKRAFLPAFSAKSIPVLLSVIAAILIASGIISLIAYNWYAIPRLAKAVSAFALLLAVQAAGVYVACSPKRLSRLSLREGVTLLWAILFGGVVAYISQICRLPGNSAGFLLVWCASSILLAYAMRSVSAFVLSLLLSAAYAVVSSMGGGEPALFCLLFAALCPFALRFRLAVHAMLALAAAMLGFVLEKSIPGLWIVCSVSFAVLCLEYGLSRNDRGVSRLSFVGLCALLLVLSGNGRWSDVGWRHIREFRSAAGMLIDCALAVGLTAFALAWPFIARLHRGGMKRWQLVYPLCALVIALLYVVYSCLPLPVQGSFGSFCLAPTVMVFLFSLLFVFHSLHSARRTSLFLLCFLCTASFTARLDLPVFALAGLLLLVEATGAYPSGIMRGIAFVLLLAATACLRSSPLVQYRLPRPEALPLHLALYASYVAGAAALFIRSRHLADSLDIIAAGVAVILCAWAGLAIPLGKDELCAAYFCISFLACAFHVFRNERISRKDTGWRDPLSYWLPFVLACASFFWAALFVLQLNYPVLAGTAFLLLFVAAACCRTRTVSRERPLLGGLARLLVAVWMLASYLLCAEDAAFVVYDGGALPFQLAAYACVALSACVLLLYSGRWLQVVDLLVILAALPLLCLAYKGSPVVVPEGFIYLSVLAGLYGFVRYRRDGSRIWLPYLLLFEGMTVVLLYAVTGRVFFCCPALPLIASCYLYGRERELEAGGGMGRSKAGTLAQALCVVVIFVSAFVPPRFGYLHYPAERQLAPMLFALALYAYVSLLPAMRLLRAGLRKGDGRNVRWNYLFALYALAVILCFLLLICAGGSANADFLSRQAATAMSYLSFAFIFLTAGRYIYEAYGDGNLAKANLCAAYAALALAIKFFGDDYGFVAKGVLFIVLGLAMLLLNLMLVRADRKKNLSEVDAHDARR